MIRFARLGHAVYLAVIVLAGLYALVLFLAAMNGRHDAQNTMIFGCGIIFIARAYFASRAALLRIRGLGDSWHASDTVFTVGDAIAVSALGLTAWAFWTNENRMAAPVAPFGVGLALASPFYLAATFQCLRRQWAET